MITPLFLFSQECSFYYLQMEGAELINQQMISAYKDMDVKLETENLELPGKLNIEDELKDGSLTMEVRSSGIKIMTMKFIISDRKVEAKENITTDAGTFECYKLSSIVSITAPMKITMKSIEWLSPETGMIKSESYNGSDKYMGKTELIELK